MQEPRKLISFNISLSEVEKYHIYFIDIRAKVLQKSVCQIALNIFAGGKFIKLFCI